MDNIYGAVKEATKQLVSLVKKCMYLRVIAVLISLCYWRHFKLSVFGVILTVVLIWWYWYSLL